MRFLIAGSPDSRRSLKLGGGGGGGGSAAGSPLRFPAAAGIAAGNTAAVVTAAISAGPDMASSSFICHPACLSDASSFSMCGSFFWLEKEGK